MVEDKLGHSLHKNKDIWLCLILLREIVLEIYLGEVNTGKDFITVIN